MDNEITVQEELESTAAEIPADAVEESETEAAPGEGSQAEELQQLRAEIMELRLKLALLTGGAAPERLCEGVKLAAGIMSADGTEPDDAAAEVLREYPHLRLDTRCRTGSYLISGRHFRAKMLLIAANPSLVPLLSAEN